MHWPTREGTGEVGILDRVHFTHLIRLALIALAGFATLSLATSGVVAPALTHPAATTRSTVARAKGEARALARIPVAEAAFDRTASATSDEAAAGDAFTDQLAVDMVSSSSVTVEEQVAFPVEKVNDAALYQGQETVAQAGVPGVLRKVYVVRMVGATVADRHEAASIQIAPPVTEIRHVGTKPRPAPTVAPARPPVASAGSIQQIILDAAARWGADPTQLLRVARCESTYNPNAYNASSGASGLFQFLPATWAANSVRAGYAGASVFNAVANANTAAMMFARGQAGQWECK